MFRQTVKDVENLGRDIECFDMSYEEIKELCTEAWKDEDCNHFYLDRLEQKIEGEYLFGIQNRNNFKEYVPGTNVY